MNDRIFTLAEKWSETARRQSGRTFLLYIAADGSEREFSYAQFDLLVRKTSNALLARGTRRGERIALQMNNCPEYLICWLAIAFAGAVSIPINANFREAECSYIIEKSKADKIITTEDLAENFKGRDVIRTEELMREAAEESNALRETRQMLPQDDAVILFTSGTTSRPKGAVYTNYNVVYGGYFHAAQIEMTENDRFLSSMPCYHMDFQEMAVMSVICSGATLIMLERFSARNFWRTVCEKQANYTDTMSIMNRTMLMQPVRSWEKDHRIKQIYFSMGLSDEDRYAFNERFHVDLMNSYGMTETVSAVTCAPRRGDKHWPSVGKAEAPYKIKIVDEDGTALPPGTRGEICVWGEPGKTLVKGYLDDPDATGKLLDPDGWLHSNDYGYLDEDGWLFFIDRKNGLIKRAGENVSSLEVECTLQSHPEIEDAAVIAVPDNLRDEAVKAFIQLKSGSTLTAEDITNYCKKNLAYFKVPTEIVFVTGFPRTATGKIQKQRL